MHSFNPSPLLGTSETTTGGLCPFLGSPERYQHSAASLLKCFGDDEGIGTSDPQEEAERAGIVQL